MCCAQGLCDAPKKRAVCEKGAGVELLTAAEMRAIEQAAIESGEVTGLELMERAGRGVVEAIFEEWPELAKTSHRAVVLCGPGNNGGDGFVVARLLKDRQWSVRVFFLGDRESLPLDARVNFDRWSQLGFVSGWREKYICPSLFRQGQAPKAPVVIDAVFGTGLARPMPMETTRVANTLRDICDASHQPIVSVDIPSGIESDRGVALGLAFTANLTVTFHRMKIGHSVNAGLAHSGHVVVKDIGL